ncbi:MAG: hypothetical protein Q8J69_06940 [Sphingobacteriaceae bacterium]|nr:hypothetical protein [Sphingobacteriaceae bacterium]
MGQILSQLKNTSSKILLLVFIAMLFSACKKEEKNVNLFEAEIDGVVYSLKREYLSMLEGEFLYTQGHYANDEFSITVGLDFCNLFGWPQQNTFPIFRDSCMDKNGAISQTQVNMLYKPGGFVSYTTYNLAPDGFSEVIFEAFRFTATDDYNIKATYRMRLPSFRNYPPPIPDSLLVTGRFHFKRTPNPN